MSRIVLVAIAACAAPAPHATVTPKPPPPVAPKPHAPLDDLKPYRRYTAVIVGGVPGQAHGVEIWDVSATDMTPGTRRIGWVAHQSYTLDASLDHITHSSIEDSWSGFGVIEMPVDVQWTASSSAADVRAAIQRHDANQPSPPLTSFVPADAPMVPEGFVPRVTVRMLIGGGGDARASFVLHDAVFGTGASATTELERNGHIAIRATLTPETPRTPAAVHEHASYRGTLAIHVDYNGRGFDRSYVATGPIDTEGDAAIAPVGFNIPGASCPSKECDLRKLDLGSQALIYVQGIEPFDDRYDRK